jgi:alkyl sulfatase BDS1-like metallo-beta-lactamase superfamily hydrolase
MADLLGLSARIIDDGSDDDVNRITLELSELGDGVAMVESFSHVVAFTTDDGLVLFDTSLEQLAAPVLGALRGWSTGRINTLVYTHGHVDHVGGARTVLDEATARGEAPPDIVGHEGVLERFRRYQLTHGYNAIINQRQFGGGGRARPLFPTTFVDPTRTFRDRLDLEIGGLTVELRHGRGETDDHTWAYVPDHRAVCVGDFVIWAFPNAGNPQKVQRYPLEWARTLREIEALRPELLLPAHGLPVRGKARVRRVLDDTATALESLVDQTLSLMNEGATLDTVVHTVRVPEYLLGRPYLRPVYDDPEFVVRNIWRGFGGWYDGDPAQLKPAPRAGLAHELVALAGGAGALTERALQLADEGELRLASHLVELAAQAQPDDVEVHEARADVYRRRRQHETSLMAKSIFGEAAARSEEAAGRART